MHASPLALLVAFARSLTHALYLAPRHGARLAPRLGLSLSLRLALLALPLLALLHAGLSLTSEASAPEAAAAVDATHFRLLVEAENVIGAWPNTPVALPLSFPELLSNLDVTGRVDPRSVRVLKDGREVPFRLSDELETKGTGTISWRKESVTPELFEIRFALEGAGNAEPGKPFRFPERIPLIGDGDYFTYGVRGAIRDFAGGLETRAEVVDWYATGTPYVIASRYPTTHDAGTYLHTIVGLTGDGVPILDKGLKLPVRDGIYSAGDFRGDGAFDLMTFTTTYRSILWYRNAGEPGNPSFRPPELLMAGGDVLELPVGTAIRGIRMVDWTGDGLLDVLYGTSEARGTYGSIYLLRNVGTADRPRFAAPEVLTSGTTPIRIPWGFASPAFHDFDGNGALDIITGNRLNTLYYIRNTGSPERPELAEPVPVVGPDGAPLELPEMQHHAVLYDLDRDGQVDILLAADGPFLYFLKGTGVLRDGVPVFEGPRRVQQVDAPLSPGALAVPTLIRTSRGTAFSIVAGNAAGEIVQFHNAETNREPDFSPAVRLEENGVPIRFVAGPTGSLLGPSEANWGYSAPLVVDWTGDGTLDVVAGSIFTTYRLFEGVPRAGATQAPDFREGRLLFDAFGKPFATVHRVRPAAVDVDGDGLPEFLTLDSAGYLAVWARTEDPTRLGQATRLHYETGEPIRLSRSVADGGISGRIKLAVGDWTGDGLWDIVLGTPMTHLNEYAPFRHATIFLLENVGTRNAPVFRKPELIKRADGSYIHFGIHSAAPALADLDDDGHLDLVVGAENGRLYYYARSYLEGKAEARIVAVEPAGR